MTTKLTFEELCRRVDVCEKRSVSLEESLDLGAGIPDLYTKKYREKIEAKIARLQRMAEKFRAMM